MYLWIDAGNSLNSGQIIIGSLKYADFYLPTFFHRFPEIQDEANQKDSCSMMESLGRQDLHINKLMGLYVNDLIWKILRTATIHSAGMYINHKQYLTTAIPITPYS
jgi:hypothetical protein